MALSPKLSYLVTDQVPPFSRRMAVSLTSVLLDRVAITHIWHGRNQSSHHERMAHPLHLTYSSEWLPDSSLPLGRDLDLENTKLLPEVLKHHSSQWLHQHMIYLIVHHNVLELHCSPLHHIPNIVIFDLGRIRLW